jgi:hypothetical protein
MLVKTSAGYYVENKDTGRRYSSEPMPKKRAEAQMRALVYAEGKKK